MGCRRRWAVFASPGTASSGAANLRADLKPHTLRERRRLRRPLWKTPCLSKQGLRLLSQRVGFEPVVTAQCQEELISGNGHPSLLLVQPPGGLVQPPPRFLGLAQFLVVKC